MKFSVLYSLALLALLGGAAAAHAECAAGDHACEATKRPVSDNWTNIQRAYNLRTAATVSKRVTGQLIAEINGLQPRAAEGRESLRLAAQYFFKNYVDSLPETDRKVLLGEALDLASASTRGQWLTLDKKELILGLYQDYIQAQGLQNLEPGTVLADRPAPQRPSLPELTSFAGVGGTPSGSRAFTIRSFQSPPKGTPSGSR